MQRIVAPPRQHPVDVDEVLHPETFALRMIRSCAIPTVSAKAADRTALCTIASMVTSRASCGSVQQGVRVHQLGEQLLVE